MRTIFEALNAEVEWVDENGVQQIIAKTADKTTVSYTHLDVYKRQVHCHRNKFLFLYRNFSLSFSPLFH